MRKRLFAAFVCLCMMVALVPSMVYADDTDGDVYTGGLCEHHPQHDESCGYSEGTAEVPCNHQHTEECYTQVTNCVHAHTEACYSEGSTDCVHVCSEESGCIARELNCKHEHDENCSYVPATEGTPCTYVCEICNASTAEEAKCICETKCTEEESNENCPVCGENGDISGCVGAAMMVTLKGARTITATAPQNGDGSSNNPYEITNAAELYWFAARVNSGETDACAKLMNDIVIQENVLNTDGSLNGDSSSLESWTPIGDNFYPYTGTFDGQNHTISGVYVDAGQYVGLFGSVRTDGTIKNVGIMDSYISSTGSSASVGGVCGWNNGGTIENSYNTSTVSNTGSSANAGGVCGQNFNGSIKNSYNTGTVSGTKSSANVSGVCGYNFNGTVENSYNTGAVSGTESSTYVGGVCGNNRKTITNCYNTGVINGSDYVGGVCGNNGGTIKSCYNTSTVSSIGTVKSIAIYVGGVCGYNNGGTIENSYNIGTVTGAVSGRSNANVGGMCGHNRGTITNCYNTGAVSSANSSANVGGVCGKNSSNATITSCYYMDGTAADNGYGGKLTENQFGVEGSFSGWDFTAVWEMDIPLGRPVLQSNNEESETVTGTEEDPYLIHNVEELKAFRDAVNSGKTDVCAKLMNDIEIQTGVLNADGSLNSGTFEEWTPIGNKTNPYTGTFDGDGHTISGLYVNSNANDVGLFGYMNYDGTIKNVGVEDSYINSTQITSCVGGVCATNDGGIIENSYNKGTISGTVAASNASVGGVCGSNLQKGSITNCYNEGIVSVTVPIPYANVGGVCGWNNGGTIENGYNTGAVTSEITVVGTISYANVGGVCGSNGDLLKNCYNEGTVSGMAVEASSNAIVGGVCGWNSSTTENSYNTGEVSGTAIDGSSHATVGGVCGWNSDTITNCYFLTETAENAIDDNDGTATKVETKDKGAFASGEVAWLLNDGQTDKPWRQGSNDVPVLASNPPKGVTYKAPVRITIQMPSGSTQYGYTIGGNVLAAYPSGYVFFADAGHTTWIDKASKTYDVDTTIYAASIGITLNKTELSLYVNDTETLTATITPDTASQILKWSSSNPEVATVDQSGKVTAIAKGTATISAEIVEGSGIKAECIVTVIQSDSGGSGGSGGGHTTTSNPQYAITVLETENGSIRVSPERAKVGDRVKVTAVPQTGYALDSLTVTDIDGKTLTLNYMENNVYTFEMPKGEVVISAVFAPATAQPTLPFIDVQPNHWFYDVVCYVVENGLMHGMSENTFSPNTPLQREMLAVILWNLEGNPEPKSTATFSDVISSQYYAKAIAWASENGIVAGYGDTFGVGETITREQFAVMLYRYAQYKGYDTTQGGMAVREFSDYEKISDYAKTALAWAVNTGIMHGMGDGTLAPQGQATRAEAATMLMQFCEQVVK